MTEPHDALRLCIDQAWMSLQEAKAIDVRSSLAALAKEKTAEWFAETMPKITDMETIVGALKIMLSKLRGDLLGPRRAGGEVGGRGRFPIDVADSATSIHKDQRSRDRAISERWEDVQEYMKTEVEAGRAPSRHGALVHIGKIKYVKTSRPITSKTSRPKPKPTVIPETMRHTDERILTALDTLADGERRPDPEIERISGCRAVDYVRYVRLIPWLTIDRTSQGTVFTIDQELRDVCTGRIPRPSLGGFTWRGFYQHLRAEITRQRKEANDLYRAANWTQGTVHTQRQSNLLDWIEDQLGRIPEGAPRP